MSTSDKLNPRNRLCARCGLDLDDVGVADETFIVDFRAGQFSIYPEGACIFGRFCQWCVWERLGAWLAVSEAPCASSPERIYQHDQLPATCLQDGSAGERPISVRPESSRNRSIMSLRLMLLIVILLQFLMLLSGCASPPTVQEGEATTPPRILLVGVDYVPSDIATRPLWIVADDSEALTNYVRSRLRQLGMRLSEDEHAATYRMRVTGSFVSEGKINVAERPVGPIFEDATTAWAARSNSNISTGRAAGLSAINVAVAESTRSGLFNQFGGNILDSLGHATGIAGAFNELITGDRRGWCFSDCERFHQSRQRARFDLYLTGPDGVTHRFGRAAEVQQRPFVPGELIEAALEASLKILAPESATSTR